MDHRTSVSFTFCGLFVARNEVEALKESTKWMAVMRVLTSKAYSATSLKKTMEFAWTPAKEVTFRDVENHRFIVQANCLGDWQRITEQGPWIFRDHGVLIEKYDGSRKASEVELFRIQAWVQIHDVPELFRKKAIVAGLAASVGELISIDLANPTDGGNYVRARVWIDSRKCLTRFVTIRPEGEAPVIMQVKYEKVPRFCAMCGFLGHVQEECGTGEHAPGVVPFGLWLLADTAWNRAQLRKDEDAKRQNSRPPRREFRPPGQDSGGRGAGRGGRTPGRGGRGGRSGESVLGGLLPPHDTRKRSSDEASLSEASPAKANVAQNPPLLLEWKAPGVVEPTEHEAAKKKLDFGGEQAPPAYVPRSGTPPPPPSAREQKRSRKSGTPKKDKNAGSAGSSGELRREQ
ncbi:hypothetical protein QYE76_014073 [Lolium multiflorum]|uniref:Zinc knuckle CX2CX4HX4C domain-containing protein n=1 Tax=Lolium multiflorum TaxID=4521 RepID=A0AAD8U1V7_LOLMU|nr:hypothetical protein QYE76_014073 [Lolium multiflorum]